MTPILTITLNPALDLSTGLEHLEKNKKLRCEAATLEPGGGGVNVARAINKLGRKSRSFAAIGGPTGQAYKSLLTEELSDSLWFDIPGMTRQSFVVNEHSSNSQYRFVLPGPEWSAETSEKFCERLREKLESGMFAVASGSLPPGVPDNFYEKLAALIAEAGGKLLVDTSGDALRALANADHTKVGVLVMDEDEACQIADCQDLEVDVARDLGQDLLQRRVAEVVAITLGARGAIVADKHESWRVTPPEVEVVSKVGAGDSFVAGLVIGLIEQRGLDWAAANAMAAATSAVTTPGTELCTADGTETYRGLVSCAAL